ncbi:MAG: FG-GAP-like repeat-containing protein, partial [Candidatus Latescibacterota bacterium]|nr:FG-GAP-like repeat-containing protein [Candidatus Latescibacterota bacterium]
MKARLGTALLLGLCCSCQAPEKAASDRVYEQALTLMRQGRFAEAEPLFHRVLDLAPDSSIVQVRLGEAQIRQGFRHRAAQTFDALPAAVRQRPEARVLEARLLAFVGFAREAELAVDQVLDLYPASLEARLLLAELYLQAAATMNLERASALCSQALEREPAHRDALHLLLQATLRLGRFEVALERSQDLVAAYPTDARAHLLAGTAALWADDAQAVPWLQKAVDLALNRPNERLEALWLLKLAYDKGGGYPHNLDPRYRFHTFAPPDNPTGPTFVDIAPQAGVAKKDRGRGSAWLDYDLDGDLDLFTVGIQVEHSLYRNDGGGQFADVAREKGLSDRRGGWSATAADYDNDGDPDLFTTRNAWDGKSRNSLYKNDLGTFSDIALASGLADSADSFTATWFDFDLDGYLDLYVANGVSGSGAENTLWHNQKNGTFLEVAARAGVADSSKTIGTAAGDYDGDGLSDLYAVNIGEVNRLYRNLGDGTFSDVAEETGVLFPVEGGYVAFFLDIDNDGQLDVFVSTMSAFPDVLNSLVTGEAIEPNRPFLYHNMGDGTFTDIALPAGLARSFGTMGAGVGDVDN